MSSSRLPILFGCVALALVVVSLLFDLERLYPEVPPETALCPASLAE